MPVTFFSSEPVIAVLGGRLVLLYILLFSFLSGFDYIFQRAVQSFHRLDWIVLCINGCWLDNIHNLCPGLVQLVTEKDGFMLVVSQ